MTLGIRKLVVIGLIGALFLLGNVMIVASWLQDKGLIGWAWNIRQEYLTGTAITIILALLILLVRPASASSSWITRCPVCDRRIVGRANYCSECGSKV